jgi:hypothetical protein
MHNYLTHAGHSHVIGIPSRAIRTPTIDSSEAAECFLLLAAGRVCTTGGGSEAHVGVICRAESDRHPYALATRQNSVRVSEPADLDIISNTLQTGYIPATAIRFCA